MVFPIFGFREAIEMWSMYGVFDVLLPMLLIFTLVFAILQQAKILGGRKPIDAVIAFIIAMFVITNPFVTSLFGPIFSQTGLALIIAVAVLVIVGLFVREQEAGKGIRWFVYRGF